MKTALRTPDVRFDALPDFPFAPQYLHVEHPDYAQLRMAYIDEGPKNAPPVLMLHGEPSWSFVYRKVIPALVATGYRVVAPDHIGFGRSDKLRERSDYSYQQFVDWMQTFVSQLELENICLLCQDWGGPIGLRTLAAMPERFSAVVAANTLLPNCQRAPYGVNDWPGEVIENWAAMAKKLDDIPVAAIIDAVTNTTLSADILAAYDAPFPDADYKAAVLEFPCLIPIHAAMPGLEENRAAWKVLEQWQKPFITAFSDNDPSTKAWEQVFKERVPGANNSLHREIKNAGHFLQEDQGESLAEVVLSVLSMIDCK